MMLCDSKGVISEFMVRESAQQSFAMVFTNVNVSMHNFELSGLSAYGRDNTRAFGFSRRSIVDMRNMVVTDMRLISFLTAVNWQWGCTDTSQLLCG